MQNTMNKQLFLTFISLAPLCVKASVENVVDAYMDSLSIAYATIDSTYVGSEETRGEYYRLFTPLTFYHGTANKALSISGTSRGVADDEVDRVLLSIYLNRPDLVGTTESELNAAGGIRRDLEVEVKEDIKLTDAVDVPLPEEGSITDGLDDEIIIEKPNFWTFSGDTYFQFLQNYYSDNWYAGGESTYSMIAQLTLQANYNNQSGIKFENKLEMKLGFQSSQSDSIHKFKTNNDLIRYTGLFGVQATKKWYYSLQLLAYTQFTRGFESNDETVHSDFGSPLTVNVGLGMTYDVKSRDEKLTGTISISALAYNMKYVDRLSLAETNGIDEGKHSKHELGSQVTTDLVWKFNDHLSWKTRLYAYTSYHNTLIEWENTFAVTVFKNFSCTLFLHPRFDDSATRDDDMGYWQFKEYSSLGFSYEF